MHTVYHTAVRLADRVGKSSADTVREYVWATCATRPDLILASGTPYVKKDRADEKHLLQAAIINNLPAIVVQILQNSDTPNDILNNSTDICLPPLHLAGISGNLEILKNLFSSRRFRSVTEMREEAMEGAVAEGQLETVKFICDPQWGPMNFVSQERFVPLLEKLLLSPCAGTVFELALY
jgi:hypothetical protein